MKIRHWVSGSAAVGITMFLVGLMFHVLGAYVVSDLELHYANSNLFRDWNAWTSVYMAIHPFFYAPVFVAIFLHLRRTSSLPAGVKGGIRYGAAVFCAGSLPVFVLAFASFHVPWEVIAIWVVQNLCQYLAGGVVIDRIEDRMVSHRNEASEMSWTHPLKRRIKRIFFSMIGLLTFLYLSTCVYFSMTQVEKILAPLAEIPTNPERMGMPYVPVAIPVRENDPTTEYLNAFWIPVENPDAPVFLYLHGQDATRGKNLEHAERFHQWGWNVLVIDYRGFGETYDVLQPSEVTVYEDALAALRYLKTDRKFASKKTFIYGHSLGGAVAIELATRPDNDDVAGLIVESTFTSIREMSFLRYSGLLHWFPVSILLTEKFDSLSKISSVKIPILFIHGTKDKKVPFEMSERLHRAAGGAHRICLIDGAGHENCGSIGKVQYRQFLDEFVIGCLKVAEATAAR